MNKQEILQYLQSENGGDLFQRADDVRRKHCGDAVYLRGLIEFSNHCVRNCLYCGLRKDNEKISRYRMTSDEIFAAVEKIAGDGLTSLVLQSGDDFSYSCQDICALIKRIKKQWKGMAVTLSVGERPLDDYRAFKDSGADRYLLKHETINRVLYRQLHPGQSLTSRIERLMFLRSLGFQIGAGMIVGLPGQTLEDLADDILFLQELQPDMIGMGPFIPQADTPLHAHASPKLELVLKCIALARLVTENAHIPSATAVNTLDPEQGDLRALQGGANVLMINYTPLRYQPHYAIYNGKKSIGLAAAKALIEGISRQPSLERGDSLKQKKTAASESEF